MPAKRPINASASSATTWKQPKMDFIFNLSRSATTLTTAQPAPVQSGLLR